MTIGALTDMESRYRELEAAKEYYRHAAERLRRAEDAVRFIDKGWTAQLDDEVSDLDIELGMIEDRERE